MTIDPSELLRRVAPADSPRGSFSSGRTVRGEAFRELLASSGAGTDTAAGRSVNAAAEAEIVRLRMMRDAVSLQTDTGEFSPSSSMPATAQLLQRLASYNENLARLPGSSLSLESGCAPELADTSPASPQTSPQPLQDIVTRASKRYGVEPGLILAVIKAESNFNPTAVSSAGARGLMQLMPGTARGLGVTDSFDPEQNVMAGTRYLRQMLDRYNGDLDSALAAYNWGPGNVDRKGRFLPRETRNYLSTVKGYYSEFTG